MTLLKKLQSRKLLVTVALLVIVTLGIQVPDSVITAIATYLGGQAVVDAVQAYRGGGS